MNRGLELYGLAGADVLDRDRTVAYTDFVFVVEVEIKSEMRDPLAPQIFSSGIDQIVVLAGNRTDFLKLPERNTEDGRAGLWPVDNLGRNILTGGSERRDKHKKNRGKDTHTSLHLSVSFSTLMCAGQCKAKLLTAYSRHQLLNLRLLLAGKRQKRQARRASEIAIYIHSVLHARHAELANHALGG